MKRPLLLLCFLCLCQGIGAIYFKHLGMSDGLSQVSVMSIYQDKLGRMWFGTREGISVYDGERMRVYKGGRNVDAESSIHVLLGHECDHLVGNVEGDIFFRTCDSLVRYDVRKEKFHVVGNYKARTVISANGDIWTGYEGTICRYDVQGDSLQVYAKEDIPGISCLQVTKKKIWVGTYEGLYVIEEGKTARCLIDGPEFYRLFESSSGEIWAGCRTGGLYRITPDERIIWYSTTNPEPYHIESNQIRNFAEDRFGNIWFGTFAGLYKYNPYTDRFTMYRQDHLPGSLSHSSVFSVFIDAQETLWVGTYYGGVNYFNQEREIFAHYTDNPLRKECLNYSFVGNLVEDKDGNIWICTEGGGLNFMNRRTRTFQYFTAGRPNSVLQNNLKSITYDEKRHRLYIGTHHGGLTRYDINAGVFHNYLEDYADEDNEPDGVIFHTLIHRDKLYVSAMNGMFVMNLDTDKFQWIGGNAQSFTIDKEENMWLLSGESLIRFELADPSNRKEYALPRYGIQFEPKRIITAGDGSIYFVVLGGGLYRYDKQSDSFIHYSEEGGHLLSNYCYNVAETNEGELLVTSDQGITFLNPSSGNTRFATLGANLPIASIADGCGILVCRNNELFVGGNDGLTSFYREDLDQQEKDYALYFSELSIYNKRIQAGDASGILQEAFPFSKSIQLNYKQNNLVINFATTNYIDIQRNNEYQYKLVGLDEDWVSTSSSSIYYTNLDPGKYRLLVREKDLSRHLMNRREIGLDIRIAQPWYKTIWAWFFYILATFTITGLSVRAVNARRRLALSLEKEREEKERNEELSQAKLRFFTNISHEFRSPLTLIISQIDMLLQSSSLPPTVYNRIIKIGKHANRMRNMISELLEFRKLEQNYVSLHVCEQNLVPFLKDIYLSYGELAAQRMIAFNFHSEAEDIPLWFDARQLQKVFYNLLSNAFKYTKQGGAIDLYISSTEKGVDIKVIDTGIGLSDTDVPRVFDRFYQAENGNQWAGANPGTGLGLALSKNIVTLHHGEIAVQSRLGYGTIFTVTLWKGKAHFEHDKNVILLDGQAEPTIKEDCGLPEVVSPKEYKELEAAFPDMKARTYKVLLVEDNEELLQLLDSLFTPFYQVILAHNGEEGLRMAGEEKPDLVVSDVMMPLMSGMEMCMKIKNNIDLCHIPVVLLTALDSVEYSIEGLQQGADDYISKPFHAKVLLMRCNNLIRNRLLLKSKLGGKDDFDVYSLAFTPLDQDLLNRIVAIIDKHIEEPDFDVNVLARELNMGRSSFFVKVKNLTGMTPNEFIQNQRIKRAATLLQERPDMLVNEISDRLGFVSSVYFSRCFKAKFGVSPLQFRKREK